MKILADATINNISSSSSSCNVEISNIQEYSNFSKLPEYLYVIVDYSKEIGTASNKPEGGEGGDDTTITQILKNYDENISFITNSNAIKTYVLEGVKYIRNEYKNFYGVYKLIANSYYVKLYTRTIGESQDNKLRLNILLMYNGSSWVFYIQTLKTFKDFLYVDMFLKNDIENFITTDFNYIAENNTVANSTNSYKIIFTTKLPPVEIIPRNLPLNDSLVIGREIIEHAYFLRHLNVDTSKLMNITT